MPALLQSTLVSGWMELSAARAVEANTKALPNAKIETTAFIAPVREMLRNTKV
jgi:hypothetical protein